MARMTILPQRARSTSRLSQSEGACTSAAASVLRGHRVSLAFAAPRPLSPFAADVRFASRSVAATLLKDEACVSSAALALRRASPPHPFSRGLWGTKLPRCGGKCCTRRCDAQIPARRAKFEPDPSCVCRWDTSVARQSKMTCASPYTRRQAYAFQKLRVCPVSDSGAKFCLAAAQHASNVRVHSTPTRAPFSATERFISSTTGITGLTAKRHRNRPAQMLAVGADSRGLATPAAGH